MMITLTAIAALICIYVEYLNFRAGSILPRTEGGKWRVSSAKVRRFVWIEEHARNNESGQTLPLSDEEQTTMLRETQESPRDALGNFLSSVAIFQYPLCSTALAISFVLLAVNWSVPYRRTVLGLLIVVLLICGAFALQRSYFTSLEPRGPVELNE